MTMSTPAYATSAKASDDGLASVGNKQVVCHNFEKLLASAVERDVGGVLGAIGLVVDGKGVYPYQSH